MTLAELIAQFRTDADDTVAPFFWSDESIAGWLNEAQEEACIRAKLIFDGSTPAVCAIAVVAGTSVYPLHPAVLDISYATLIDQTEVVELGRTDRIEQSRLNPHWRVDVCRPTALIQYDTTIELNAKPPVAYALRLEVNRLPLEAMKVAGLTTEKPEIAAVHHRHLVLWALHRAFSKPDAETIDPTRAATAAAAFEAVFGRRPDANLRKSEQANLPHVNKAFWI